MTSKVFTSGTIIDSAWLNDVNNFTYAGIPPSTLPTTDIITYKQGAIGSTIRTLTSKEQEFISVKDFGAIGDGVTNDSAAFASAIAASSSVYVPAGTYRIASTITIRKSNFKLFGAGVGATIIKLVDGGTAVNVINVGKIDTIGAGDEPWSQIQVSDMTLDGNRSTNVPGAFDINGWGILTCAISKSHFSNLNIINCWIAGAGNEINSNYNTWDGISTDNCGHNNGTYPASVGYPSFDVNSSKYCQFNVISSNCIVGARMLDNCYGNYMNASVYNATLIGFVYNNQAVNSSYANIIDVNVNGGCTSQGVNLGANCFNSIIRANVSNVTGFGYQDVSGANLTAWNNITLNTYKCGSSGAIIGGSGNTYNIINLLNNQLGAIGSVWDINISGTNNNFNVYIQDSATPRVRGVQINGGAVNNNILSFGHNTLVQNYSNLDTTNSTRLTNQAAVPLANTAIAIPCPADTTEDVLATIAVPAGLMGLNGTLRIDASWSFTGSANAKTVNIRFGASGIGGTLLVANTTSSATVFAGNLICQIQNRGVANSQIASNSAGLINFAGTAVLRTAAIDTTTTQYITITGQKGVAGDTLTLERYLIELIPG